MPRIGDIRHWLLDVEGTLVVDKDYRAVTGAPEFVATLRERGDALRILTNNTTATAAELAGKLTAAGIPVDAGEIVSGQRRAAAMLAEAGVTECALIGSEALASTLREAGLTVHPLNAESPPPFDVRALVLGYPDEVSAALLGSAVELLRRPDAVFVALHVNRLFRNRGRLEPGLGAWAAALEVAAGRRPLVAGKPAPELFRAAAESLGVEPARCAMVGDDPHADLASAKRLGMTTVFVLSGKYEDESALADLDPALRPDLVLGSLADLRL